MKRTYSVSKSAQQGTALRRRRITRRQLGTMTAGAALSALAGSGLPKATTARATGGGLEQVKHIVVVMQENHSFDNYFGQLHAEGQPDADGLPNDASNPDPTNPGGAAIEAFHGANSCAVVDLDHSWNGTHLAIGGGQMDGFTATNQHPLDPNGSRAMSYHTSDELGFYYGLYSKFAIGDRYFSSVPGPTFPNRYYLLAGTSFGHIYTEIPNILRDPRSLAPPNGTILSSSTGPALAGRSTTPRCLRCHLRLCPPQLVEPGADRAFYQDARLGGCLRWRLSTPSSWRRRTWRTTSTRQPTFRSVSGTFPASSYRFRRPTGRHRSCSSRTTNTAATSTTFHRRPQSRPTTSRRCSGRARSPGPSTATDPCASPQFRRFPAAARLPRRQRPHIDPEVHLARFSLPPLTRRVAAANPMLDSSTSRTRRSYNRRCSPPRRSMLPPTSNACRSTA